MKKLISTFIIFTVGSLLLFTSCEHRSLERGMPQTAKIPVRIDWSLSAIDMNRMHRASVILFPLTGGAPLEYRMETDLEHRIIDVPVGVYSVVVFNETTDENDWTGITFTGKNRYDTFAAEALPDQAKGFYSPTGTFSLMKSPDLLAAWSVDRFEVTPGTVMATTSAAPSDLETLVPNLVSIKPTPRIEKVVITARVTNLSSSMQVTGILDGMASGIYMVDGRRKSTFGAHAFILNGRVYDSNGKDGTTTRMFTIFGTAPDPAARYMKHIDFLLTDGKLHPRESFDITDLMTPLPGELMLTRKINVGYSTNNGDHMINLPDMDVSAGVTVDDWDEIIIPLK